MLSPVRLSAVVGNVRAPYTQPAEIFGNVSMAWPSADIQGKFCGDRPRGIPPSEGKWLNARGVALTMQIPILDLSKVISQKRCMI